ncbi:MAG: hypothetical protein ACLFU1_06945 [Alphaproteobacteria bacterium]
MSKSLLRLAILSTPLVLTACGEGWEAQRTDSYMPYGNSRTAGTGVAYVRAKLLPQKKLVVEPVMSEVEAQPEPEVEMAEVVEPEMQAEPVAELEAVPEPVLEAEEIFTKAQHKGAGASQKHAAVHAEEGLEDHDMLPHADSVGNVRATSYKNVTAEQEETEAIKSAVRGMAEDEQTVMNGDDESLTPMPSAGERLDEEHSSLRDDVSDTYSGDDGYIAQTPKTIVAPKVEVIKSSSYVPGDKVPVLRTAGADLSDSAEARSYQNEVSHPAKRIVVPRKDRTAYLSVGEEELDEIYNQPF